MKLMQVLKADIVSTVKSKELYIAIGGILGALWLPVVVELQNGGTSDAIYYLWMSTDISAFRILILAFSAFPFALSFISGCEQKIVWEKVSRVGLVRYCISKAITTVVFAMSSILLGLILLVLCLSIRLPLFDGSTDRGIAFSQFLINDQPLKYVWATAWSISIFSASWAMAALCLSTNFQSKCYITSLIVIGYYILNDLSDIFKIPYLMQIIPIGWGEVDYGDPKISLIICTVLFGTIIAGLSCLFYYGVRRKAIDA